ncbi:MAG: hypothetical protein EZS28_022104 [Streblomastix strix]|uniref:Uncharacterized protein n=1 Tax=Streblomastix strix TaxID=222440 RepID=A0A5J4VIR4_9EUKA|nr:MAG: hypothetical protein EZS28_022104 [Streblomastix strix]
MNNIYEPIDELGIKFHTGQSEPHRNNITALTYIPSVQLYISASFDGTMKLWSYPYCGHVERTLNHTKLVHENVGVQTQDLLAGIRQSEQENFLRAKVNGRIDKDNAYNPVDINLDEKVTPITNIDSIAQSASQKGYVKENLAVRKDRMNRLLKRGFNLKNKGGIIIEGKNDNNIDSNDSNGLIERDDDDENELKSKNKTQQRIKKYNQEQGTGLASSPQNLLEEQAMRSKIEKSTPPFAQNTINPFERSIEQVKKDASERNSGWVVVLSSDQRLTFYDPLQMKPKGQIRGIGSYFSDDRDGVSELL